VPKNIVLGKAMILRISVQIMLDIRIFLTKKGSE